MGIHCKVEQLLVFLLCLCGLKTVCKEIREDIFCAEVHVTEASCTYPTLLRPWRILERIINYQYHRELHFL